MSADTATLPTREELVERAAALRPLLTESAAQADDERNLPASVIEAISDAGIFRLFTPKRFGGYEADVETMLEVVGELGRGDMSAGWVTGVLVFSGWQVGVFGEQAQRDVWGSNPDARVCSVISAAASHEPAEGGIVVTGQWPAASGSTHSDWAVITVPTAFGPRGPEFTAAIVPLSDLTIDDTWYPAGVRGSGSNTLVADKVFVPQHRLLELGPAMAGERGEDFGGEALYRSSFAGVASIATLASQLGLADTVLELVKAKSQGRMIPTAGIFDQSDAPTFQLRLGEAATKINAAWLLSHQAAADTDAAAQTGQMPNDEIRARTRGDAAFASQLAYEAVESLMTEAGLSAFVDGEPLQRLWRDLSTAHRHTAYRLDSVYSLYGSILLGKGPGAIVLY